MAGRYKILDSLAAGGVGEVYKAFDTQLDRYVAIKRLLSREETERGDNSSSTLKKEAASLATLQHPNIVSVYDLSSDDTGMFIVMELLEGDTLADWLQRGPMDLNDFKEFATQTLEGTLSAHQVNILHRDLKPENIKMNRLPGGRLQAKIVDFGLARMSYAARKQTEDQSGNVLGSIFYMAPEQLLRKSLDGRTDLYSLGCVFYQCLSGRKPFDGETVRNVMDAHLQHEVPDLREVCPHVPGPICEWVMWMINLEQVHRPANARAALDHLRALVDAGWFATGTPEATAVAPILTATSTAPRTPAQQPGPASGNVRPPSGAVRPPSGSVRPASGTVRPVTGSQPPVRATSATQRPASALGRPPGGTQRQPEPVEMAVLAEPEDDASSKKKIPVWVYPAAAVVLVGGGLLLFSGGKKGAASPSSTSATSNALVEIPKDFLQPGCILHYRAGEKNEAYGEQGKAIKLAEQGDRVVIAQDLAGNAGTIAMSAVDRKMENCPKYAFEKHNDLNVGVGMLHFEYGQCMSSRIDSSKSEAKQYPFGSDAKKKGLTAIALLRPSLSESEVRCFQLRSSDGKAFVEVRASANNDWRAKAQLQDGKGGFITKEGKLGGRDTKKFNLIGLSWDATTNKIVMAVRSHDGGKSRSEFDAPKDCPPLTEVRIAEPGNTKSSQFSGDLVEFALWPFPMDSEMRTAQEMKFAELYFKNPGKRW